MKLEKIELIGFKSFADRTVIHFHPGVTCIVGPNGCGKSNIVDAFRWVLGEQSAKVLRGHSMQEVIFNGSESRKPSGMAEVNLYFSFPEPENNGKGARRTVVVSRRLYRSGESEYLINKNPCRLKDIRDLFLDTGLEMKTYSILEQGSIGQIISAKPQDRRFLIEEVAGVMKYKVRRAEAETKLQNARLNLQRVEDILSEVKRQRNSLQRQAKRAEKYMEIKKALIELELKVLKSEMASLQKHLQRTLEELNALNTKEADLRKMITKLETELQKKKSLYTNRLEEFQKLEQSVEALEDETSNRERRLVLIEQEKGHINEQITSLKNTILTTKEEISQAEQKLAEINTGLQKLIQNKETTEKRYHSLTSEAETLRAKMHSVDKEIERLNRELFTKADQIGHKRNALNRVTVHIEQIQKRLAQIDIENKQTEERRDEVKQQLQALKNSEEKLSRQKEELTNERANLHQQLQEVRASLQKAEQRQFHLKETIASLRARHSSLRERIYGKVEIEKLQETGLQVLGVLSQMIDVPVGMEKAIEAALADKISAIVVNDKHLLLKTLNRMAEEETERATFIVPEDVFVAEVSDNNRLSDLVKTEDGFRPLIKTLLGDCVLCEGLEEAIRATEENPNLRAVTKDGFLVQWGFVITVGKSGQTITLTRIMKDLERQIEEETKNLEQTLQEIEELTSRSKDLKTKIKEIEVEVVNTEKELFLLNVEIKRTGEEIERLNTKASMLSDEKVQLLQEKIDLEKELEKLNNELQCLTREKEKITEMAEAMRKESDRLKGSYQSLSDEITDAKSSLERLKERIRSFDKQQKETIMRLNLLKNKLENASHERIQKEQRLTQLTEEEDTLRLSLKKDLSLLQDLRDDMSHRKEALQEVQGKIDLIETRLKDLQKQLQEITEMVHKKQMEKRELELRIEGLVTSAKERLGIDILKNSSIEAPEISDEDHQKIEMLRERLKAMEPVNLAALDEFKQVEERFQFLTEQHQDIVQSIEELEEAISRINKTTGKRLKEAFEVLNIKFKEVFQRLFNGGNAELILTSENILEAGIEIVAQPPGKRLQNINLLSGGEKAMTALALMFGGFLIKPTPICILDEADAPLDEHNTHNFIEMIKELSKEIQFILITHNRLTMETADYLYGVTMDTPGVTKIISYKLTETSTEGGAS